jgi:hypothetical protein
MLDPLRTPGGYDYAFVGTRLEVKAVASHENLTASARWDIGRLLARAQELAKGTAIQFVTLAPAGGSLDIHFAVCDREAGYEAAAPIVSQLLEEFALLMDFHFVDPQEALGC